MSTGSSPEEFASRRDQALQLLFESRRNAEQTQFTEYLSKVAKIPLTDGTVAMPEWLLKQQEKTSVGDIDFLEKLDVGIDLADIFEKSLRDLNEQAELLKIKRRKSSIVQEEHDLCSQHQCDDDDTVISTIKDTTILARLSIILITKGLLWCATHIARGSKRFYNISSAISYLRERNQNLHLPTHLLLEWEKNIYLFDLFSNDESLYCNKNKAQDMYDICMETYDWILIFFSLYKKKIQKCYRHHVERKKICKLFNIYVLF